MADATRTVTGPSGAAGDGLANDMIAVPGEHVLLLAVDLPMKSAARRQQAAPFAIEDRVAAPLAQTHVALGPRLEGDTWLVAAIDIERMRALDASHPPTASLIPEMLFLPVPLSGAWTVLQDGERCLVRLEDGTGSVMSASQFAGLWQLSGSPRLYPVGKGFTGDLASLPSEPALPASTGPAPAGLLDLRQGVFARRRSPIGLWTRRVAAALVAGLAIYSLVSLLDLMAIRSIGENRADMLVAEYRAKFPDVATGTEILSEIDALASRQTDGRSDIFLGGLSQIASALGPAAGLSFRDLAFDGGAGTFTFTLETGDLNALQDVAARLEAAGLTSQLRSSRAIDGGAEGQFTVQAGGDLS